MKKTKSTSRYNIALGMLASTTVLFTSMHSSYALTTANLHLQGNVNPLVAISVATAPVAVNLNLHQDVNNLKVADVQEFSNSATGYKVTLVSANAGNLRNATSTGQVIKDFPYTASYNGIPVTLSQTPQQVTLYQSPVNDPVTFVKSFNINYAGIPQEKLPSGTYQDDLTFEIAAL